MGFRKIILVSNFPDQYAAREDVLLAEHLKRHIQTELTHLRDLST